MPQRVRFFPMPGKIAVRLDEGTEYRKSGLILLSDPSNSKIGEVIAIYEPFNLHTENPDQLTEAFVQVGDLVVFGRHNGVLVKVGGEECVILKETEILTKIILEETK